MKKQLLIALALTTSFFNTNAQTENKVIRCYAEEHFQEMAKKDPSLLLKRAAGELQNKEYVESNINKTARTNSANLIIPVVVHVIHEGGSSNISDAQIRDQIRILNEDYQRLNADTVNTPAAFLPIVGRANIEFRLATKDPNGNCTDGIVRVYHSMTSGPSANRDEVKSVSYWNSQKYLNMWVVSNINSGTTAGTILGYAQFPGGGAASTDGVVIRSDCFGSIETASSGFAGKGRTSTHEVGHWLSLRHIWGDATCGNDGISDTPTHQAPNSGCPSFPHNVGGCSGGNANGEFYVDYMDYSDGACENAFSAGQVTNMLATLSGFRSTLVSSTNNINTGTDDASYAAIAPCAPVAYFAPDYYKVICQGGTINYIDQSYRNIVISRSWTFQGGSPATSTNPTEAVTYPNAGIYNTSLNVTGSVGSDLESRTGKTIVLSNVTGNADSSFTDSFEDSTAFVNNWIVLNYDGDDKFDNVKTTCFTGSRSIKLGNSGNGGLLKDELISPNYNLSWMTAPTLQFRLHFAAKTTASTDKLKVYISTNCGQSWTVKYTKSANGTGASNLGTIGNQSSTHTPPAHSATEWRLETIALPSVINQSNFRFKFEFTSGNGNNLFIDDIHIAATPAFTNANSNVGINELVVSNLNLSIYPNPAVDEAVIAFNLINENKVRIELYDLLGKRVQELFEGNLQTGQHTLTINSKQLAAGSYIVKANVNNLQQNIKLIVSK